MAAKVNGGEGKSKGSGVFVVAERCESGAADPTYYAGGVMTGADYRAAHGGASATFDGLAIAGGDVVLMATCAGDATLDGSTDTADLGVVLGAFGGLADDGAPRGNQRGRESLIEKGKSKGSGVID